MIAGFFDGSVARARTAGLPAKAVIGSGAFAVIPPEMVTVGFTLPLDRFCAEGSIHHISEQPNISIFGSAK